MTAHDDDIEARLRDALHTEAAMVQPGGDGLQRIREGVGDAGRPWWQVPALVLGVAAVVLGIATGAYLGLRGDDGGNVVADGPSSGATAPTAAATESASQSAPPSPEPTSSSSPISGDTPTTYVYYLHDDATGPRLYREQHQGVGDGDPAERGLRRMLQGKPDDPDYATPWDATTLTSYAKDGTVATVDLSGWVSVPRKLERAAVQEIVYTVTANDTSVRQVRFLVEGQTPTGTKTDVSAPVARAPRGDVQGLIWLLAPKQGATAGSPVSVDGFGTAFEGTINWDVRRAGAVVAEGATQGGANGEFAEFHDTVQLDPGEYEISAYESSAENGDPLHVDTKNFTVR
jgi:immunoglobulin-like protein involved in spore germination/sporulation and spore germination protein